MARTNNCNCDCCNGGNMSGSQSGWGTLNGKIYAPNYVSAYSIAVANGFKGTEQEWLESLQGENGDSAYTVAVENGFQGTVYDWLRSLVGPKGDSAYDVAVANGFEGTQAEWLESLKAEKEYDHTKIINRDAKDSHPISAITGLEDKLQDLEDNACKITEVKVNGNVLDITDRSVNVTVPTKVSEIANDREYQTKEQVTKLIDEATEATYKFKGSVESEDDLPKVNQTIGDVYNIILDSSYGPGGMNVAWTGSKWDALGSILAADALTEDEIKAICA